MKSLERRSGGGAYNWGKISNDGLDCDASDEFDYKAFPTPEEKKDVLPEPGIFQVEKVGYGCIDADFDD